MMLVRREVKSACKCILARRNFKGNIAKVGVYKIKKGLFKKSKLNWLKLLRSERLLYDYQCLKSQN